MELGPGQDAGFRGAEDSLFVIAGLVPAIPLREATTVTNLSGSPGLGASRRPGDDELREPAYSSSLNSPSIVGKSSVTVG